MLLIRTFIKPAKGITSDKWIKFLFQNIFYGKKKRIGKIVPRKPLPSFTFIGLCDSDFTGGVFSGHKKCYIMFRFPFEYIVGEGSMSNVFNSNSGFFLHFAGGTGIDIFV